MRTISVALLAVFVSAAVLRAEEPGEKDAAVRRAVTRALPYIEREGVAWIDSKKCVSCHQVPFMVWSLNAAHRRGFAVDKTKLTEWNAWAVDYVNFAGPNYNAEKNTAESILEKNVDTMGQLLLAQNGSPVKADSEWVELFRTNLARTQADSGMWNPCGQLPGQKRPARETQEVTTLWSIVALRSAGTPDDKLQSQFDKAVKWLGAETPGKSTEWWAVRMTANRLLKNAAAADRTREDLLNRQHGDGSWGWLCDDPGDALGTGIAVYALLYDGVARDHAAIVKGLDFLCRTQQDDGSWVVKGTKTAKKDRVEPTSVYWGACWAVIALTESLPSE